jgi:hypothetical protein
LDSIPNVFAESVYEIVESMTDERPFFDGDWGYFVIVVCSDGAVCCIFVPPSDDKFIVGFVPFL